MPSNPHPKNPAGWWGGGRFSVYGGAEMTYEEAVQTIPLGRYRHFKGNEYEVIGIARQSEDESPRDF